MAFILPSLFAERLEIGRENSPSHADAVHGQAVPDVLINLSRADARQIGNGRWTGRDGQSKQRPFTGARHGASLPQARGRNAPGAI
jgi:hypothetical protein